MWNDFSIPTILTIGVIVVIVVGVGINALVKKPLPPGKKPYNPSSVLTWPDFEPTICRKQQDDFEMFLAKVAEENGKMWKKVEGVMVFLSRHEEAILKRYSSLTSADVTNIDTVSAINAVAHQYNKFLRPTPRA